MFKKLLFLLILFASAAAFSVEAKTASDVLGIRVGMSKSEASVRLQKLGKLEKDERKQQQIWALTNDPNYSYLIIAYNKEFTEVRFVTAKAKENGRKVRYSDVVDLKKAKQVGATNNYKYVQEIPASGKNPGYVITARGQDSEYLTYFSIEKKE
jgi:hypothetical protein